MKMNTKTEDEAIWWSLSDTGKPFWVFPRILSFDNEKAEIECSRDNTNVVTYNSRRKYKVKTVTVRKCTTKKHVTLFKRNSKLDLVRARGSSRLKFNCFFLETHHLLPDQPKRDVSLLFSSFFATFSSTVSSGSKGERGEIVEFIKQ